MSGISTLLLVSVLTVTSRADDQAKLPPPSAETIDFQHQVKPLLKKRCVGCHGPKRQRGGLRLDTEELAHQGGDSGPVLVVGKSGESRLIQLVASSDADEVMPPTGRILSPAEISTLRAWIDQGASYGGARLAREQIDTDHWAFQRIQRPPLPALDVSSWARQPLDLFVISRLQKEGFEPSAEADRATLIRRVGLDLTGLLPSPGDVERFLADDRPDAYEQLVDRLLASPHYGERWGGHWLDVARYADSNGFTIDGARSIWKYRDWVIEALNRDLPFDQFTVEQLAGDLLPDPTVDQLVATGFHRNSLINEEGGTDDEQFRVESIVDRVNTTGAVWLGLTIGCAQCHTHKYDPITQREYYELYAFFNNTEDTNTRAPMLKLPRTSQEATAEHELVAAVTAATETLQAYDEKLRVSESAWETEQVVGLPIEWSGLENSSVGSAANAQVARLEDGSFLFSEEPTDFDTYTLTGQVSGLESITGVRIEVLTHESLPSGGPGRPNHGNFALTGLELKSGERTAVWSSAYADDGDASKAIDGDTQSGWSLTIREGEGNESRKAAFVLKKPLILKNNQFVLALKQEKLRLLIGRFRVSVTGADPTKVRLPFDLRDALVKSSKERTEAERAVVAVAHRESDAGHRDLAVKVVAAQEELKGLRAEIPDTLVMRERMERRETNVQIRGNFLRKGARVFPSVPAVLPGLVNPAEHPTRLDLARWLVDPRNPLPARVTVNRIWQRYFGLGLVETENDFGVRGARPTHPELLDWLASEFVALDWSLKDFHRMIVTSATYRQASVVREDLTKVDARNRWLGRQNRLRLEAEGIRDAGLAASGLLTPQVGGPGVYPPQPKGIYVFTQTDKNWRDSHGRDRYRRGMYTYFWRSGPYPFFSTFDKTKANVTCTRRVRSNTPLQALTLANDKSIVEFAQGVARRILRERKSATSAERIEYAFRVCLGRVPNAAEAERLGSYFAAQRAAFVDDAEGAKQVALTDFGIEAVGGPATETTESAPAEKLKSLPERVAALTEVPEGEDLAEVAAWTSVARVLLNLDEFITRE